MTVVDLGLTVKCKWEEIRCHLLQIGLQKDTLDSQIAIISVAGHETQIPLHPYTFTYMQMDLQGEEVGLSKQPVQMYIAEISLSLTKDTDLG